MALSANEKRSIEGELDKTKAIASGVVEDIVVVNNVMVRLRDQSYETMADIRSAADKLILEVRSHEEKLIAKVTEILEWKEAYLQKQKKTLEDFLAELQQSIDYTSDVLNKPDNKDINEWKTAMLDQLQSLHNMNYHDICKAEIDDGSGFIFLYDNEQLLSSIASYGSIVNNVKRSFNYDRKDGEGTSGIPIIPVITLNGLVIDLEEKEEESYEESDTDSSDEYEDESEDEEESNSGKSDDNDDDDDDDGQDAKYAKPGNKTYFSINDDNGDNDNDGSMKYDEKKAKQQKIDKSTNSPKTSKGKTLSTLL